MVILKWNEVWKKVFFWQPNWKEKRVVMAAQILMKTGIVLATHRYKS
jgi:hypothetical protein